MWRSFCTSICPALQTRCCAGFGIPGCFIDLVPDPGVDVGIQPAHCTGAYLDGRGKAAARNESVDRTAAEPYTVDYGRKSKYLVSHDPSPSELGG